MGNINQMELQSLREIIGAHQTMASKFDFYSNQCQDPNIKKTFLNNLVRMQVLLQVVL